jgi:hypothetical protein
MKKGRPDKYDESMAERAGEMAECGYSDRAMWSKLGIEQRTFYNYKKEHKVFAKAIEDGRRRLVDNDIEPSYMQQAIPHDEVVELRELRGRGKKKKMTTVGERVHKDVVNVLAAEKILKVHKPEKYGDKLQLVGGIKVSFNVTKNYAGSTRKSD